MRGRDEFGIHAAGLLEEGAAQLGLDDLEALDHAGQPSHRLDGNLGDHGAGDFGRLNG